MEWKTPHQTPPFKLIKTEHFLPAVKFAIKEAKAEIATIVNNQQAADFDNTILVVMTFFKSRIYSGQL